MNLEDLILVEQQEVDEQTGLSEMDLFVADLQEGEIDQLCNLGINA